MTEYDLALLRANERKRVELTCVDGETVIGEIVWVAADDVLLDAVEQPDGTVSSASVLSVRFSEIAAVRALNE
jgi:hypothetical protein